MLNLRLLNLNLIIIIYEIISSYKDDKIQNYKDTDFLYLKIKLLVSININSNKTTKISFLTNTVIRNNLYFNLHNFLMSLTEWIYKPLGLTKLYIPRETLPDVTLQAKNEKSDLSEKDGQYISNELRESEKAQIDRFERIVRFWIKQIREALTNITNIIRGVIFDELQHWTAIC